MIWGLLLVPAIGGLTGDCSFGPIAPRRALLLAAAAAHTALWPSGPASGPVAGHRRLDRHRRGRRCCFSP